MFPGKRIAVIMIILTTTIRLVGESWITIIGASCSVTVSMPFSMAVVVGQFGIRMTTITACFHILSWDYRTLCAAI